MKVSIQAEVEADLYLPYLALADLWLGLAWFGLAWCLVLACLFLYV